MEKSISFLKISLLMAIFTLVVSCGVGQYQQQSIFNSTRIESSKLNPNVIANRLAEKAFKYEKAGKHSSALKKYKNIAEQHPLSNQAPNARYRIAQHYERRGKRIKAFDSYQTLINNYMDTPLYRSAIEGQIAIAHEVADGSRKRNTLFFNSRIPSSEIDRLLKQVVKNAPQAKSAAKSQYLRGLIWEHEKQNKRAITEYREVTLAYSGSDYSGEALFRIGSILYKQSKGGNTNLDISKRAIEIFDELSTLYPKHPKVAEAKIIRAKIEGYDIRRSLEVAQFHMTKREFVSAAFYYRGIMERTSVRSDIHQKAKAGLQVISRATTQ